MKSSLASTPMAFWMSMKRSGLMWANWRTPPFMPMRAALAHRGDQIALLQKARRGVVLDRVGELHLEIVILLVRAEIAMRMAGSFS